MFSKLFKKRALEVFAPIEGEIIQLENVPDPVFSEKMMGEGIAIMPTTGKVLAPFDGKVMLVADSKHAIGLQSNDEVEVLIHVGLETVALNGEGFTAHVSAGDTVTKGQLLMEVDLEYIKEHAKSIITPVVITNSDGKNIVTSNETQASQGNTVILTVSN